MLLTIVSVVTTAFLTLLLLALYVKRTLPGILEDVALGAGESITESLKTTFETPNVKKAMSILGKQSGDARADKALQKKAADAFMDQSPVLKKILNELGFSSLEAVQLFNDPTFGPMIKGFIGNITKNANSPNFSMGNRQQKSSSTVPLMGN